MNSEKIENLLNLAVDVGVEARLRSPELSAGYDTADDTWEVIVKHFGSLAPLQAQFPQWQITELLNEYAIMRVPQEALALLAELPQIEYIEKPKQLFFEAAQGRRASCMLPVQTGRGAVGSRTNLTGAGTLVGVIDSGIDYRHPDFCNADGTSRIVAIWDQTAKARDGEQPPEGYRQGVVYTKEQIDAALAVSPQEGAQLVPQTDTSGHGTHVAGIAAGNGRASGGANRGVAYESLLLIVKLGVPGGGSFPRTTELMTAVDYCIKTARELQMPLALNLSFGNNYGSHSGTSLLETYLTDISGYWKCSIAVGSGNEATKRVHVSGVLRENSPELIELAIANFETGLNIQLWKSYSDSFAVELVHPDGVQREMIRPVSGSRTVRLGDTELLIYYGQPSPYSPFQELYFELLPAEGMSIDAGIWQIRLLPEQVVDGTYHLWLPAGASIGTATGFLRATPDTTLTIPSTAAGVLTVGAYDSYTDAPAAFSGRGYTRALRQIKPDLAAPGVDILSCAPGGGYVLRTGTSMATPFVTGAAALLMQYGIVAGRDPYLYGEKIRAYLLRGARRLPGLERYPNEQLGWGALCAADSLPASTERT